MRSIVNSPVPPPAASDSVLRAVSPTPCRRRAPRGLGLGGSARPVAGDGRGKGETSGRRYLTRKSRTDSGKATLFQLATLIPGLAESVEVPLPATDVQRTPESPVVSVSHKRKRLSPDRIPNPPGCSYGMWDKYFEVDDEDEEPVVKKQCVSESARDAPSPTATRVPQKHQPKTPSRLRVARRLSSAGKSSSPKIRQAARMPAPTRKKNQSLGTTLGHEFMRRACEKEMIEKDTIEKDTIEKDTIEKEANEKEAIEKEAVEWLAEVCPTGDFRQMEWPMPMRVMAYQDIDAMDIDVMGQNSEGITRDAELWALAFAGLSGGVPKA
ncbi:hypothetical protein N7495_008616 [Penicillium taxi]|uniref:uncharacterized protein n=1 Tax=Penicillium taxi TaxID=168475 RepID=UPI002544E3A4|nr:uncharacterized protein N7495_008616 [Penicillium taxi]KAJ5888575.1 hypothetical protein N7495_008616 [Penicillium taxi]